MPHPDASRPTRRILLVLVGLAVGLAVGLVVAWIFDSWTLGIAIAMVVGIPISYRLITARVRRRT